MSFEGKAAVVTGGGSGIGQATVWALAEAGARVIAGDINAGGLQDTLAKSPKGRVAVQRCDVTAESDVAALVGAAMEAGGFDVAVNCAGIDQRPEPFEGSSGDVFERVMRVNAYGVWLSMRFEAPALMKRGGGAIINVASVAGLLGGPRMAAYIASKHACIGLTRAAAFDLAPHGIRVNAVCPGPVATPMLLGAAERGDVALDPIVAALPAGRMAEPREIAEGILYLASDQAKYVIGALLTIDGGLTLA